MKCEKPMPRLLAQSSMAVASAPDWGNECELARQCIAGRKTGVEPHAGDQRADAVGAEDTRLGLFAFALCSALLYARTVAVAGIVLAPLLAATLQTLVGASDRAASRIERMVVGGAFVLSLAAAALILPHTASGTGNVPHRLDRTLAALPRGTVVWNADALGGWLLWEHPNVSQTMDTRAEVYGATYVDAYVRASMGLPGWESTLDATDAKYALIGTDTALRSALAHERGWVDLGSDEGYTLLRSPSS